MTTHVVVLLDASGSMGSIIDDTIGGFNAFVANMEGDIRLTLIQWDTERYEKTFENVAPSKAPKLSRENYIPAGGTPLLDRVYRAIQETAQKPMTPDDRVQIVIQTDGYENKSREVTRDQLKKLIEEKQTAGWLFTFLGAGIDAFADAGSIGIKQANTMSYDRQKSDVAFAAASRSTVCYATTGDVSNASFTDQERKDAE